MPDISGDASGLAGRYAVALFELAREQDALEAIQGDLQGLKALLGESSDLRRLVGSPVLTRDDQAGAMMAIAERGGAHDLTRRFLGLLANNRRLFALPQIIDAYAAMLARHKGEVAAEVVSAAPLSREQLDAVRRQLRQSAGQDVNLSARVDPGLLGGLVVRIGSRMIDASLRSKLHQLELAMKGAA